MTDFGGGEGGYIDVVFPQRTGGRDEEGNHITGPNAHIKVDSREGSKPYFPLGNRLLSEVFLTYRCMVEILYIHVHVLRTF